MKSFKGRMTLAVLLGSFAYLGGTGLTISSAWLITMASQHPPILTLSVSIVMVRFFGISRSAARYGERLISHEAVFKRLTSLRVALFERLGGASVTFARDLNSGLFVKSIVDDVERAQEYQLRITLPHLTAAISLGLGVLLGWWVRPESLLVIGLASALLLIVIPFLITKVCESTATHLEIDESHYAQSLSSSTFGMIEANMYGYLESNINSAHILEKNLLKNEVNLLKKTWIAQTLTSAIIGGSITASAFVAYQLSGRELFPAVKITMVIFLPLVIFEAITMWYPNLFQAGKLITAKSRVDSILEQPLLDLTQNCEPQIPVHEITLTDVKVSWAEDFMKQVTTSARSGSPLVIRGVSGSGKSTLAMGILGLLPYQGSIMIGGCELREIKNPERFVTGSLQNGHIFNTSLRENLKIAGPAIGDEEIQEILEILELNGIGLDTVLGEFGRPLSGGEAKRLGIARALLSKASLVILDEPTAHLDVQLAARIETRILDRCANQILIIITHSGWGQVESTFTLARE
jgi:thiol reductant ABC exporter CydC subunit